MMVILVKGAVAFDVQPRSSGFCTLFVASSDEQMMWDVAPIEAEPTPVLASKVVGMRLPSAVVRAVTDTLTNAFEGEREYPPVTRIIYGEVPNGYRQQAPAIPLVRGERYCVQVFGRGFDRAAQFFCGP